MSSVSERTINTCLQVIEMEREEIGLDDEFLQFSHIDSLKALDLLTALEREFGIKMKESELREFESLNKVIAVVERYVPETA